MRSRSPSSACSTRQRVQRAPARGLGALPRRSRRRRAGPGARARRRGRAAAGPTSGPARRGPRPRRADRAAGTDPAARCPSSASRASMSWSPIRATGPGRPDAVAPCQRWPPSNTSCTSASSGAPMRGVDARRARPPTRVRGLDREEDVLASRLDEQRPRARSARRGRRARADRASPDSTCEPHMFHGTRCAAPTTRSSRDTIAARTRVVDAARNSAHRAAVGEPGHADAARVDERVLAQHVERAHEIPAGCRASGFDPAIDAATRFQSQWYLSAGFQSARSPKQRRSGASTT